MSLTLYQKKRNFKKTPEPESSDASDSGKLTFVVQRHDASHLHYDFRLEMKGVLKSWAVPKGPSMDPAVKRLAVMVEDHPLSYGKFYGTIPKGNYGAGVVEIWDDGTYKPMENSENEDDEKVLLAMMKKGDIKITLNGHYLKGSFALIRMNDDKGKNWLLIKKKDKYAEDNFDIEKINPVKLYDIDEDSSTDSKKNASPKVFKKDSVNKYWDELQKPMLAKLTEKIFDNPQWLYELKFDGYRVISKVTGNKIEMISRGGLSYNRQYKPIVSELEKIEDEVILDGEVLVENEKGIPEFQLLQNYLKSKGKGKLQYHVFDILFLNGHKLTELPLINRKELLSDLFEKYKFKNILLTEYIENKGTKLFDTAAKKGYEGVMAKELNSLYYPGKRSSSWLKIKTVMQQEAIIAGYTKPQGSRQYIGSLILAVNKNNELKYIGNCGTGFTEASLKELHALLVPLEIPDSPFNIKPSLKGVKGKPVWVKPELICEVKFSEWTNDGSMRHPVFNGLREDKKSEKIVREVPEKSNKVLSKEEQPSSNDQTLTVNKKKVKVTNLNKIYWKDDEITKGDLIKYYIDISNYILPYLKNRPQSLNRHPNGIDEPGFFQKDMDVKSLPAWTKTAKMYSSSNKKYIDYLICNNTETLVYMANLGCIEINPWNSVYTKPDHPGYLIIDLDPGSTGFKDVIETALVVKDVCDEAGLKAYCKTSGATGIHIYLPLDAKYDYDQVKTFAQIMATIVQSRLPDITSIERTISKRKNKLYIDFLQNRKGQTIAAPYSARPKPHATVSTPLMWSELKTGLSPHDFTIFNIMKRLDKVGDLWEGVLGKGIPLLKALKKLEKM